MSSPILIFDGDCGFCTTSVRLAARLPTPARIVPYQELDLAPLPVNREECSAALQYVDASGGLYAGHHAVAAFLGDCGGVWRLLAWPLCRQGLDPLWDWVYQWVADHRTSLPGGTPACAVPRRRDAA